MILRSLLIIAVFGLVAGCATMQKQREKYVSAHSGLTDEQRRAILDGEVVAGMTGEMVVASWGRPIDIVNEVIEGKNVSSWIYEQQIDSFYNTYKVQFIEGVVHEVRLLSARERRYSPYRGRHYWRTYPEYP